MMATKNAWHSPHLTHSIHKVNRHNAFFTQQKYQFFTVGSRFRYFVHELVVLRTNPSSYYAFYWLHLKFPSYFQNWCTIPRFFSVVKIQPKFPVAGRLDNVKQERGKKDDFVLFISGGFQLSIKVTNIHKTSNTNKLCKYLRLAQPLKAIKKEIVSVVFCVSTEYNIYLINNVISHRCQYLLLKISCLLQMSDFDL